MRLFMIEKEFSLARGDVNQVGADTAIGCLGEEHFGSRVVWAWPAEEFPGRCEFGGHLPGTRMFQRNGRVPNQDEKRRRKQNGEREFVAVDPFEKTSHEIF